jgi:hypothetical protein
MEGRFTIRDAGRERIFEICDDVTTIGSGETALLRLKDNAASKLHCELRRTDLGFKLVDMESGTGTMVNDQPVNQAMLRDGDVVRIGQAALVWRGSNPRAHAPAMPAAPIRRVPVDAKGDVRRFYRHDAPRRSPSLALALASAFLLGGAGLLWLHMNRNASEKDAARTAFASAQRMLQEDSLPSTREAIKRLQAIDVLHYDARTLEDALHAARRQLARLDFLDRSQRAATEHARVVAQLQGSAADVALLDAAVDGLRRECSDTRAFEDLVHRLDAQLLAGTGLQRAWQAVLDESQRAMDSQNYAAALHAVEKGRTQAELVRVMARRLSQQEEHVRNGWHAFLQERLAAAERQLRRGQREEAVRLFRIVAEAGLEPESAKARSELAKPRS